MTLPAANLHPWNGGFEWQDHSAEPSFLDAAQLAQFDRDGFVVLPDVFTAAELAPVVAALDEAIRRMDDLLAAQPDERLFIAERDAITFAPNTVATLPETAAFVAHPALLGIAADVIGPDVDLYWEQAVYKHPAKPRRFPWHQDNGYRFIEPQAYLTCWIALTDATSDTGCPQVAPGGHRRGTLAHRFVDPLGWQCFDDVPEPVLAEVGAGGVVVFSSLTPHLTGPNTAAVTRKAYIVQYAPPGAEVLLGDPAQGPPTGRERQGVGPLQPPVLRGGRPVGVAGSRP